MIYTLTNTAILTLGSCDVPAMQMELGHKKCLHSFFFRKSWGTECEASCLCGIPLHRTIHFPNVCGIIPTSFAESITVEPSTTTCPFFGTPNRRHVEHPGAL